MPIRPLTAADKKGVLSLDSIIFKDIDPEGGWLESDFNQFFNKESCYVAYANNQPNSFVGYIFATQKNNYTHITNMGVDPNFRKRGIGTALMKQVMLQENELSIIHNRPFAVRLEVDTEYARRFYEKLGFKIKEPSIYGTVMLATSLPVEFKNVIPTIKKSRKLLAIRNIEGISFEDLKIALEGLAANQQAPAEFNLLLELLSLNNINNYNEMLELFNLTAVRDYIYNVIKDETGSHIIYHLNGISSKGVHEQNANYIFEKLKNLPENFHFEMLYLGGGHGDPQLGSSNLNPDQLINITNVLLKDKNIKCSSIILGSCFSTAYLHLFQPLLTRNGVTISNSLECGGNNNFQQAMAWSKAQRNNFYSEEDIHNSIKVPQEIRSAIRRVLEGRSHPGVDLTTEYRNLLAQYTEKARNLNPHYSENQIYEARGDLFNADLGQLIIKMQARAESINEEIEKILRDFPLLNNYIQDISNKIGKQAIFKALIDALEPTITSLVVGASNTLTMLNFSALNKMPPNASGRFKEDYSLVVEQARKSNKFSKIHELIQGLDAVSARTQFNTLFNQAIEPQAPEEKEEIRLSDEFRQFLSVEKKAERQGRTVSDFWGTLGEAQREQLLAEFNHLQSQTVSFDEYCARQALQCGYNSLAEFLKQIPAQDWDYMRMEYERTHKSVSQLHNQGMFAVGVAPSSALSNSYDRLTTSQKDHLSNLAAEAAASFGIDDVTAKEFWEMHDPIGKENLLRLVEERIQNSPQFS